ncbi:MAG: hypothetical protein ACR2G4_04815 [Pyrinomonadaceae bacterium]
MSRERRAAGARVFGLACAALCLTATSVCLVTVESGAGELTTSATSAAAKTVVLRLRSFAPRASGRVEVEPTKRGGRVRVTAVNLPPPQNLAPNARAYVAWASGGRIVRLGELRRDARGSGSLVFSHPPEFTRYSLIVTAETSANATRPTGAPVFSTRANEVAALFPVKDENRARRATPPRSDATAIAARNPAGNAANETPRAAAATTAATPATASRTGGRTATTTTRGAERAAAAATARDFNAEIDEAIKNHDRARTLMLVGDRGARRARAVARVATQNGTAYVRVRFRRVPPASRFGAGSRYAMWALIPEDGTVYLGSLPTRNLNGRHTYARTEGVNSDKFRLLVTAEPRIPTTRLRGRRVLMTYKGRRRRK